MNCNVPQFQTIPVSCLLVVADYERFSYRQSNIPVFAAKSTPNLWTIQSLTQRVTEFFPPGFSVQECEAKKKCIRLVIKLITCEVKRLFPIRLRGTMLS